MNHWFNALATQTAPSILVTVAKVAGSAPRAAGAKMLVTPDQSFDTIGGGHLEMRAIDIARAMLTLPAGTLAAERHLQRIALGPSLGQCCGGAVHLAFERREHEAADDFNGLDQHLAEHILRHNDFAWFGMIGSETKRRQFEHRLRQRGMSDQRLAKMVCPIGLPGIRGKEPAVIAASVAAQLLQVWEAASQGG